jgi:hypothetical protein
MKANGFLQPRVRVMAQMVVAFVASAFVEPKHNKETRATHAVYVDAIWDGRSIGWIVNNPLCFVNPLS